MPPKTRKSSVDGGKVLKKTPPPPKTPRTLSDKEKEQKIIAQVQADNKKLKSGLASVSQKLDQLLQASLPPPPSKTSEKSAGEDHMEETSDGQESETNSEIQHRKSVAPAAEGGAGGNRTVPSFDGDSSVVQAVKSLIQIKDIDSVDNDPGEALDRFLIAGTTLDPKLRAKIYTNQYVELGSRMPKNQGPPGLNIHSEVGASSQFSITSAKVRQPANIHEWHKWFTIYAAVYTQKYPEDAPALFTYVTRIFKLRDSHPNTFTRIEYMQFRRVRAFVILPGHKLNLDILKDSG